jgi:hypothetical protein
MRVGWLGAMRDMRFENECECGCLGADDIIEMAGRRVVGSASRVSHPATSLVSALIPALGLGCAREEVWSDKQ